MMLKALSTALVIMSPHDALDRIGSEAGGLPDYHLDSDGDSDGDGDGHVKFIKVS